MNSRVRQISQLGKLRAETVLTLHTPIILMSHNGETSTVTTSLNHRPEPLPNHMEQRGYINLSIYRSQLPQYINPLLYSINNEFIEFIKPVLTTFLMSHLLFNIYDNGTLYRLLYLALFFKSLFSKN